MAYDIRPLAEKIRNGSSDNAPGALIVVCGMMLYGAIFGESEADKAEKLRIKQEKMHDLVTWMDWSVYNCTHKGGKALYVCNNGWSYQGMPDADVMAYKQCKVDIKGCLRVPDRPTMFPAVAGR